MRSLVCNSCNANLHEEDGGTGRESDKKTDTQLQAEFLAKREKAADEHPCEQKRANLRR